MRNEVNLITKRKEIFSVGYDKEIDKAYLQININERTKELFNQEQISSSDLKEILNSFKIYIEDLIENQLRS